VSFGGCTLDTFDAGATLVKYVSNAAWHAEQTRAQDFFSAILEACGVARDALWGGGGGGGFAGEEGGKERET